MGKIIVIGSAVQRQRTALGGQLQMRKKRDLVPFMDNNSVWTVNDRKKAKQEIKRAIETEKEARLRIHRQTPAGQGEDRKYCLMKCAGSKMPMLT